MLWNSAQGKRKIKHVKKWKAFCFSSKVTRQIIDQKLFQLYFFFYVFFALKNFFFGSASLLIWYAQNDLLTDQYSYLTIQTL